MSSNSSHVKLRARRGREGERLVGELAPELAPMLASLQMPANFVPMTNAVLAEMVRTWALLGSCVYKPFSDESDAEGL